MKVLLTGANGYVGKRLLPVLVDKGYHVVCSVRDKKRFNPPAQLASSIEVVEADLLDSASLNNIPKDIDGAFYLVHSMSNSDNYKELELKSAKNFTTALDKTNAKHVVYLGGIANSSQLSKHLSSRKQVEEELSKGKFHFTALRAGIIIGSGSASFEIIRDLVEKLPIMVTPKWLNTKCQPIAIADILRFLSETIFRQESYDQVFDIGGPDVLTYKEMLLIFSRIRGLRRKIFTIPIMTPRLSSYWLYFVTSTSYKLAVSLVNSMKVEVVCRPNDLAKTLKINPLSYEQALRRAFTKIESNQIISSWKDAFASSDFSNDISEYVTVPSFGCYTDFRAKKYTNRDSTVEKIWSIGGDQGWYHGQFLWKIRGYIDKAVGGVGLRRGRTNLNHINTGDVLDFWRVLYANKEQGRLLLYAEMKLPGEAWLEFSIADGKVHQKATFRPLGLLGRLYWFLVLPLHNYIFDGLLKKLSNPIKNDH